jgi:hypothetical protein
MSSGSGSFSDVRRDQESTFVYVPPVHYGCTSEQSLVHRALSGPRHARRVDEQHIIVSSALRLAMKRRLIFNGQH